MAISPTGRDQLIKDAQSLPDLVARAQALDPDLAKALTSKALIYSKTIWGNAVALIVSWAVTKYALGWDADTCALVTGLIVMGVTGVLRYLTSQPISGVLK
jgi:hypothetical protein